MNGMMESIIPSLINHTPYPISLGESFLVLILIVSIDNFLDHKLTKLGGIMRFSLKRKMVRRFWMLQILRILAYFFSLAIRKPAKINKLGMPKDATKPFESVAKEC